MNFLKDKKYIDVFKYLSPFTLDKIKRIREIFKTIKKFDISDDIYESFDRLKSIKKHSFVKYDLKFPIELIEKVVYASNTIKSYVKDNVNELSCYSDGSVYLFSTDVNKLKNINYDRITNIVDYMRTFVKSKKVPKIFVVLSDFKKQLPVMKNSPLDVDNINSGVTYGKDYIVIWREEEVYRVIIHELIHYLDLDFHEFTSKSLESIIYDSANLDHDLEPRFNEAYVDSMAIIINCYLAGRKYYEEKASSLTKQKFIFLVQMEIMNSILQCAKILNYYGFLTYEDLFRSKEGPIIKDKSHAFSYYIVKSAILFNSSKLIEKLYLKKQSYVIYKKYLYFVYNSLINAKYIKVINLILSRMQNTKNVYKYYGSDLRMSVVE